MQDEELPQLAGIIQQKDYNQYYNTMTSILYIQVTSSWPNTNKKKYWICLTRKWLRPWIIIESDWVLAEDQSISEWECAKTFAVKDCEFS